MTSTDTIGYHREKSWHFLDLVDDELDRGELEEASNKLWGAAAHAIKALAEARGWWHGSHQSLGDAVDRVVNEEGAPPDLRIQYVTASGYHRGFYGSPPSKAQILAGKPLIAEFVRTFESLGQP